LLSGEKLSIGEHNRTGKLQKKEVTPCFLLKSLCRWSHL